MARVKKVMLTNVPTLKKEAKIGDAAKLLTRTKVGCIIIVENDIPVGIVTELDLVRNLAHKGKTLKDPVVKLMSSPVTQMDTEMTLDEAIKIIDTKRFRKYPAVDNGKLVGLVTKESVIHDRSDNMKFHRTIQNTLLISFILFEFFIFIVYGYLYRFLRSGA